MKLMTCCLTFTLALAPWRSMASDLTPAQVFKAAAPSVVTVFVTDESGSDLTQGSGVVFSPGRVITNCHLMKHDGVFEVSYQERRHKARLVKPDADRDLCILSAPTLSAPPAQLGRSSEIEIGAPVYAIGAPQGFDLTLSDGLLSGRRGTGGDQIIQTTAPISVGSSGGGLFDAHARLIGITTLIHKEAQQINFAVPVEWIAELEASDAVAPVANKGRSGMYRYTVNGLPRYSKDHPPAGSQNVTFIPSTNAASQPPTTDKVYRYEKDGVIRYSSKQPPEGTPSRTIEYQTEPSQWYEAYKDKRVTVSFKFLGGDKNRGIVGWEKYVRATPISVPALAEKITYTMARKSIRCSDRATATAEVVYYAADGRVISSSSETDFGHYEPVVPDSVGEAVLEALCN